MTTTLPATLYDPAVVRTHTPLRDPECRRLKQHTLVWAGVGLCCHLDYSHDEPLDDYLERRDRGGFMHDPNMPIRESR